tara:strand:- start:2891 stop:3655 length:765 start_codon:yes stop_codon:yes gene_type:complete
MNAALVIAMYGDNWPYLDLWLSSLEDQPMDVLFFSDREFDAPKNVKIHKCTMDDVFDRAEESLSVKFESRYSYKLCDLKSFYGQIFEEELKGYEYWGYGDCDVVYGKLPYFGDLELYCAKHERSDMDLVTTERPIGKWFIPGHFVMMRNDERGRSIYDALPTAKRLLEEDTNNYIDEWLVPTVLIHKYGVGAGGITAQDFRNIQDLSVEKQADGSLLCGSSELNYVHWYDFKGRIKSPYWRDIPKAYDLKSYIQ